MANVNYKSLTTPDSYKCSTCGKSGVKLWREYMTFGPILLWCLDCVEKDQKRKLDHSHPHDIGWRVAAVPDEEGVGYWGYTSVPQAGVEWWDSLNF